MEGTDESIEAPYRGQTFVSWEKVEEYYKRYGKQQGFGISRIQYVVNVKKERRCQTWRCECWGTPHMKKIREAQKIQRQMEIGGSTHVEKGKIRNRKSKKCDCKAKLYASVNLQSLWEIRDVILHHNGHEPIPSDARLVKEYRMQYFNGNLRRRVLNDVAAGVPINQIHASIARERDGLENMPVGAKDMRHYSDKERKLKLEGGDAMALMAYLDRMKRDNKDFYHSVRVDVTGGLQDVFWVDARSKAAYEEFGDVVCFDTTYMTNDYELPFANFVGVNHHGQSTLFGCAFISHEDIETFNWVFNQWLQCMEGKAPAAILTDQAPAMRRPIAELMPNTTHRWCIWHILSKLPEKLGAMKRYDEFKDEFLQAIYNSLSTIEFKDSWCAVINKYGLQENGWLADLYDDRGMWIPAFMRDVFWAGMRTTQRIESIHRFFDQFVKATTKLVEFGEKYILAVESRMCQERDADARDKKWRRGIDVGFALEHFFRRIYTDEKFREFQKQRNRMNHSFVCWEAAVDEETIEYVIDDAIWVYKEGCRSDVLIDARRLYKLVFNTKTQIGVCDCRLFQTHGIICRHLVRVLFQNHITEPPEYYILHRWKKNVERKHCLIKVAYHDPRRTLEVKRLDQMQVIFDILSDKGCLYESTTQLVSKVLVDLIEQVTNEVQVLKEKEGQGTVGEGGSLAEQNATALGTLNRAINVDNQTPYSHGLHSQSEQLPTPGVGGSRTSDACAWASNTNVTKTLRNPPMRKKRGRPRGSRIKGEAEKAIAKSRNKKKKNKKNNSNVENVQESSSDDDTDSSSHDSLTDTNKSRGTKKAKKEVKISTLTRTLDAQALLHGDGLDDLDACLYDVDVTTAADSTTVLD